MKFISSLAARTGQEFNASDIAKDIHPLDEKNYMLPIEYI